MKNPNQARKKTDNKTTHAPSPKRHGSRPLLMLPEETSLLCKLERDPFQNQKAFEIQLDWIGDTMEPEVFQGNLAMIERREDMFPCAGELIIGLLNSGRLIFGAWECVSPGRFQIAFINSIYEPEVHSEEEFEWLYPLAYISILSASEPKFRRITKTLEFFYGEL